MVPAGDRHDSSSADGSSDGSVVNTYAEREPDELPGLDFRSGRDLPELSRGLASLCNKAMDQGMWSSYERSKLESQVDDLKSELMSAIKGTIHESRLTADDEWLPKGGCIEGQNFPMVVSLDADSLRARVLGDNSTEIATSMFDRHCRRFRDASPPGARHLLNISDLDIAVSPRSLVVDSESQLVPTDFPGYYELSFRADQLPQQWLSLCDRMELGGDVAYTLSPEKVQSMFSEALENMSIRHETPTSCVIAAPHGLACQLVRMTTRCNHSSSMFDLAFALKCQFWPSCAADWATRKRLWPDEGDVRRIVAGGVHLVAKSPPTSPNVKLWRLTFSLAEVSMCRLPLVYWYACLPWKLVKMALQLTNLENSCDIVTSYHVKTLFFYALERVPVDTWLNHDNLLKTIVGILDEVVECLVTQTCPHYFAPAIDLMSDKRSSLAAEAFMLVGRQLVQQRRELLENPAEFFLPRFG